MSSRTNSSSTYLLLLLVVGCSPNPQKDATPDMSGLPYTTDGGMSCPSPIAVDTFVAQRKMCAFTTGAKATDTLPLTEAQRASIPIKNIIVMMKENRSFDHLFGKLHDEGQPDSEAMPANFSNLDLNGTSVPISPAPTTCIAHDADHQWASMHACVDNGKMDGFVKSAATSTGTDGHFVMSYYDEKDIPFYYWLVNTYAINDRHFPSAQSGTFPNRNFMLLGTADGVQSTGSGFPNPSTPTIFDLLDQAGISWGVYSNGSWLDGTLDWPPVYENCHRFPEFISALDDGSLPQVVFVDAKEYVEDEHPSADLQLGEQWSRVVYQHVSTSALWPNIALIYTYDEGGGFFDHVPPPNDACIARPVPEDEPFFALGVRTPLAVISPYARAHYVSHVVQDHTAITRFIETVFDLPALTSRDANSDALLDMFDFDCPSFATPPQPIPPSGTGGCANALVLTTSQPQFMQGQDITINFTNAYGTDGTDWIVVYPYTQNGPTPPQPNPLLWEYINGTQTAGASPKSGSVVMNAGSVGKSWPLTPGGYIAYYAVSHTFISVASIDFEVH